MAFACSGAGDFDSPQRTNVDIEQIADALNGHIGRRIRSGGGSIQGGMTLPQDG